MSRSLQQVADAVFALEDARRAGTQASAATRTNLYIERDRRPDADCAGVARLATRLTK